DANTLRRYRSVILSQRIPLDICGAGTLPPTVTNTAAPYIQEHQALLRASVVPNGGSSIVFFEWGTSTSYGSTTPLRNAGDGYRSVRLGETITGLACDTTYHYHASASNVNGTTQGVDGAFTTPSCPPAMPVVTVTASDPIATENPMTPGVFLIERTGSTAGELVVTYSIGGTAIIGTDHTLGAGNVSIPAGSASRTLILFPLDDSAIEDDETVVVTLQPQSQYVVGSPNSAAVVIESDDMAQSGPTDFYTLTPCRLVDTRNPTSSHGGPPLSSGILRSFPMHGLCGIPSGAQAL